MLMEQRIFNEMRQENERLYEENNLLKNKLQAQTERSDFVEECLAEMATKLYV